MYFYVAASVKSKESVSGVLDQLKQNGHSASIDWTKSAEISEDSRDENKEALKKIAAQDYQGVVESDVFILLTDDAEGRSMYVELGIALAALESQGKPLVYLLGEKNNQSIFYYHSGVRKVSTIEEMLSDVSTRRQAADE